MVPRGAMLNEIETVNGSVTVSNFTNIIKISAVNGSVKATNIRGTASLSTVNGEVIADFDRLESGTKVMPTFHPAYLLRDPHKKREVWEDMKMVRDYLNSLDI